MTMNRRDIMKTWVAVSVALLLLALCGCGGGGGTSDPGSSMGTLFLRVKWPTSQTRLIPTQTQTMEVTVTGQGIDPAITGTITRPEDTITLNVSAGTAREVTVVGKDNQEVITTSGKVRVDIYPDMTTAVNLPLLGLNEPGNDDINGAVEVATDGTPSVAEALDQSKGDIYDWFKFEGKKDQTYTVYVDCIDPLLTEVEAQPQYNLGVYNSNRDSIGFSGAIGEAPPPVLFIASQDDSYRVLVHTSQQGRLAYVVRVKEGGDGDLGLTVE